MKLILADYLKDNEWHNVKDISEHILEKKDDFIFMKIYIERAAKRGTDVLKSINSKLVELKENLSIETQRSGKKKTT